MGRISELRTKAQRRTSNLYDTLFTRRVSIYITALLYPLGVSANAISALGCLVALAACSLIGFGSGWQILVGVGLVHLVAVLDSVDGELARLRQTFTLQGLFLEDLAAYTMIPGFFLAIGGYLLHTRGVLVPLEVAVVIVAFGRNAMQVARRAILKSVATRRPASVTAPRTARPGSGLRTFVEKHVLHYTNVWIVLTSLILVEQLAHIDAPLVMYAFYVYTALVALKELAAIAIYATTKALDRDLLEVYDNAREVPTTPRSGSELAGDD